MAKPMKGPVMAEEGVDGGVEGKQHSNEPD